MESIIGSAKNTMMFVHAAYISFWSAARLRIIDERPVSFFIRIILIAFPSVFVHDNLCCGQFNPVAGAVSFLVAILSSLSRNLLELLAPKRTMMTDVYNRLI